MAKWFEYADATQQVLRSTQDGGLEETNRHAGHVKDEEDLGGGLRGEGVGGEGLVSFK